MDAMNRSPGESARTKEETRVRGESFFGEKEKGEGRIATGGMTELQNNASGYGPLVEDASDGGEDEQSSDDNCRIEQELLSAPALVEG